MQIARKTSNIAHSEGEIALKCVNIAHILSMNQLISRKLEKMDWTIKLFPNSIAYSMKLGIFCFAYGEIAL